MTEEPHGSNGAGPSGDAVDDLVSVRPLWFRLSRTLPLCFWASMLLVAAYDVTKPRWRSVNFEAIREDVGETLAQGRGTPFLLVALALTALGFWIVNQQMRHILADREPEDRLEPAGVALLMSVWAAIVATLGIASYVWILGNSVLCDRDLELSADQARFLVTVTQRGINPEPFLRTRGEMAGDETLEAAYLNSLRRIADGEQDAVKVCRPQDTGMPLHASERGSLAQPGEEPTAEEPVGYRDTLGYFAVTITNEIPFVGLLELEPPAVEPGPRTKFAVLGAALFVIAPLVRLAGLIWTSLTSHWRPYAQPPHKPLNSETATQDSPTAEQ